MEEKPDNRYKIWFTYRYAPSGPEDYAGELPEPEDIPADTVRIPFHYDKDGKINRSYA